MMGKVVAAAVALLVLAGCGTDVTPKAKPSSVDEVTKVLEDGRSVTCLVYAAGNRGGMSCDWDGAQ